MMITDSIGQRLRIWRDTGGYDQRSTAKEIGVTAGELGNIERGLLTPTPKQRAKIEALINGDTTDWRATASALEAENARLVEDNRRLAEHARKLEEEAAGWERQARHLAQLLYGDNPQPGAVVTCDVDAIVRSVAHYDD